MNENFYNQDQWLDFPTSTMTEEESYYLSDRNNYHNYTGYWPENVDED